MPKSIYEMSDEELLALDPNEQVNQEVASDTDVVTEPHTTEPEQTEEETPEQGNQEQPTEDVTDAVYETPDITEEHTPTTESVNEPEQEVQLNTDNVNEDYEAFYKVITAPFKANGKEFQLTDPNDVIRLAQQGINYSKKMEQLKPRQAVLKTLEQHGLLDNDKLSYLIDLNNKKPEAIAKLIQESEIDLYSFDTDQANDYTPTQVVEPVNMLTETIDELTQETPEFLGLLNSIVDTWDDQSKQLISDNPQLLRILNAHNQSGLFEKITNEIEYAKMLGRLNGLSYLQAYQQFEQKFVNAPVNQSFKGTRPSQAKQAAPNSNTSNKTKAAMPNSNPTNNNNTINPLALSDEEFLKLGQGTFS